MECFAQLPALEGACSIESHREMEATLRSLRSLICDLLRENHELRMALLEQRSETTKDAKGTASGADSN